MRPIERIVVLGGVLAAILISLAGRVGDSRAFAAPTTVAPGPMKFGTVDVFVVAEALMEAPELKKMRTDAVSTWQAKSDSINKELKELDTDLSILPQNDPKVQDIMKKVEIKRQDYQKLVQDRMADLERINSTQLIDAYGRIRAAAEKVAAQQEYTHVFSSREYARQITTTSLSQTLQELLARPIINGGQVDDLTKAVLAELKVAPK